ncbi:hypothetical protein D3C86_1269200 [compost metagenome]
MCFLELQLLPILNLSPIVLLVTLAAVLLFITTLAVLPLIRCFLKEIVLLQDPAIMVLVFSIAEPR